MRVKGGWVRVKGWVGEGLGQRVGGSGSSWWRERQEKVQCFPLCINIFLYKIKNCKNNCKMWRIGNCFLSAPVHIPPNEIPHQTPHFLLQKTNIFHLPFYTISHIIARKQLRCSLLSISQNSTLVVFLQFLTVLSFGCWLSCHKSLKSQLT